MRNLILTVAALALAAPAFAQTPGDEKLKDRPARQLTGPDVEVIREAVNEVKADGECTVVFTVSVEGKATDLEPSCTNPAYEPYVLRAMETVTYEPEIFAGEVFDTEGLKQPFKFGSAKPSNVTQAVLTTQIDPREVQRAMSRVKATGSCEVEFVVDTNGKPQNVTPNCTPTEFDSHIKSIIEKMRYTPATNNGKPVEAKMTMPLNLGAEE